MHPLDYPDRHFVRAAEGWLELGDSAEAARELKLVSRAAEGHPDVLELRWRLHALHGQWNDALEVAEKVTSMVPDRASGWIHQSYCLHELKRTSEAWDLLLEKVGKFPKESIIPYNLACYACQMGDMAAAKEWLRKAAKLRTREEIRAMAANDPDLGPIRDFIESL